ncbi:B3 domain-containing protein [Gossypium australe]|uniref:B3 domain-containing protein n=1 Tax=Gossypium australe TaxID=47621 RepID=A0A5B6VEX9_9ROSI|nr:B3 domain-containing protein [Gossypium australe]
MAAPTVFIGTCFHCQSQTDVFFSGWQLRDGSFALLCHPCGKQKKNGQEILVFAAILCLHILLLVISVTKVNWSSAFVEGRFCETFHPEASGWRECDSCNKGIHCGCIMAAHSYAILDFGGVKCLECCLDDALVRVYYLAILCFQALFALHRNSPTFSNPEEMQASDSHPKASDDTEETVTADCGKFKALRSAQWEGKLTPSLMLLELKLGVDPIASPDSVALHASPDKIGTPTPGAVPAAETEGESSVNSPAGTKKSRKKKGRKNRKDASKQHQIQARAKSSFIPLFEKKLTASDVDTRNGRLVLPKRCAEAYFPKILGQQGIFLTVQDTKGNDWEVFYRYWSNTNGKMYVLEGLKDYMIMMEWEAGDTVTFYKREEDEKLLMGFKKYQAPESAQKFIPRAQLDV